MSIKLLKINVQNLNCFENNQLCFDFYATKKVYQHEVEDNEVCHLFNNIYLLNKIAIIGKNATGKSTTMNIISDIMKIYIDNKSITECKNLSNHFNESLYLECILYNDSHLYKVETKIRKKEMDELFFDEEIIYEKKVNSRTNKENFSHFDKEHIVYSRKNLENPFLKKEDSIFSYKLNELNESSNRVLELSQFTNFNFLGYFYRNMPISFVNYLDDSIETLEVVSKKNEDLKFKIKFKNSDEFVLVELEHLHEYLSSGTIKGINILINIEKILLNSGYLFIDEIENHFNKTIVLNLISLFTDRINVNNGTLIFTTHYSEIIDSFGRRDSIYVMDKNSNIMIHKFSELAKLSNNDRKDKKKSDLFLSGLLSSAPSYSAYNNLKNSLKMRLNNGKL